MIITGRDSAYIVSFLVVATFFACGIPASFAQSGTRCGSVITSSYGGIAIYSNDGDQWTTNDCDPPPQQLVPYGVYGNQFQCVEYVKRFYYQALGVTRALNWTGNAIDFYYSASSDVYDENGFRRANNKMLTAFPNGSSTAPQPNDILVFGGHGVGHVAIVSSVTSTDVTIFEQNWSTSGTTTLPRRPTTTGYFIENRISHPLSGGTVYWSIIGWLREPAPSTSRVYDFSYRFASGDIVTGSFTGTPSGNLITGLTNISVFINGIPFRGNGSVFNLGWVYNQQLPGNPGSAVASFDGTANAFTFYDFDPEGPWDPNGKIFGSNPYFGGQTSYAAFWNGAASHWEGEGSSGSTAPYVPSNWKVVPRSQ